jgi:hypothetical protein
MDSLGWGAHMPKRKLRNIRSNVTRRASIGSHVIGSALGVFSRTSASYLSFFTGYLPFSHHFISTFNNGFHLWCFRLCCVVLLSSLITSTLDFCYIFRDLDVSWFLPLIFMFIQHLNHYFVDLLQFCHRCLR